MQRLLQVLLFGVDLTLKTIILGVPALGILYATSTVFNIVWWVIWIGWMMWICPAEKNTKICYCISWLLIPHVIWLEGLRGNRVAEVILTIWTAMCGAYLIQQYRVFKYVALMQEFGKEPSNVMIDDRTSGENRA